MKFLFVVFLLTSALFGGSLTLNSGSIEAHTEMMMDKEINPLNSNLSAELNIQDENILTLSGQFWVDMNAFVSDNKDRDEDMYKSVETVKFKLATFTILNVTRVDKADIYTINGKLNFHGVEKDLSANAIITFKDGVMNFEATSMINMPDYGIEMPCIMFMCVRDRVDLKIKATFFK